MGRETLMGLGYSGAVNQRFKGAELVTRHGDPAASRHSLQIEVNRRLYMDEARVEKTAGFDALKADIDRLVAAIVDYARDEAGCSCAESWKGDYWRWLRRFSYRSH